MRFSYSSIISKTDTYLRLKRSRSRLWRALLPERIFEPSLWLWESRSVSAGAAWGVFWAFAPVPMQSIFAILSAMWHRANVPIALAVCWISFPGYQLFIWPAQWWLGHRLLALCRLESGFSLQLAQETANTAVNHSFSKACANLGDQLPGIAAELLLGCIVSCTAAAFLTYGMFRLLFRFFHGRKAE